ncbi:MAG: Unknown protein [uncultured Sulfurovum sp.]|uniref:Uncharacterized protein n=1 Tax=uncultured Sulfurovum sp. TaxID=269237 RepID=A0A6S6SI46_9BACT|nr:MAG: Unknown protein [uncultured Sulfurovum sp.]
MISINKIKKQNPKIYQKIFNTFNNKNFPCIYGKISFNKNYMYTGLYKDISEDSITHLANDLSEMSNFLLDDISDNEKKFSTFIAIFDIDTKTLLFDELWYKIIKSLHKKDKKEWVKNATKNLNHKDFKFSFNGELWYPVLITPNHPNHIRRSEITILSFQADKTFERNKNLNNEFYQKIRKEIHQKINKIYTNNKPHYLSNSSTGKGIVQFLGYDFEKDRSFKYPKIF